MWPKTLQSKPKAYFSFSLFFPIVHTLTSHNQISVTTTYLLFTSQIAPVESNRCFRHRALGAASLHAPLTPSLAQPLVTGATAVRDLRASGLREEGVASNSVAPPLRTLHRGRLATGVVLSWSWSWSYNKSVTEEEWERWSKIA
ncbi:hypothetical protein AAHA92_33936 [Salvia divinorum]|uniref:Uncharacterized protein n=1 Tax=Salvia divinorum TaxID=28513 RepID=A0ABD1FHE5_SALDI